MKDKTPSNTRVMQFFAYVQMHDIEILQLGELQDDFLISARQEQDLLGYLVKKGSIIRRRALILPYLIVVVTSLFKNFGLFM